MLFTCKKELKIKKREPPFEKRAKLSEIEFLKNSLFSFYILKIVRLILSGLRGLVDRLICCLSWFHIGTVLLGLDPVLNIPYGLGFFLWGGADLHPNLTLFTV